MASGSGWHWHFCPRSVLARIARSEWNRSDTALRSVPERVEAVNRALALDARVEEGVEGLVRALEDDAADAVIVAVPDRWHAEMVREPYSTLNGTCSAKSRSPSTSKARGIFATAQRERSR